MHKKDKPKSQAGKGSRNRIKKYDKWDKNYEFINWKKPKIKK